MAPTQVSAQNTSVSNLLLSEYFTEAELAATLGKSVRTLQRLNCVGLGPPRTVIGRLILYKKNSVLDWIASHEQRRRKKR
jgi:helix-turn-helix protein